MTEIFQFATDMSLVGGGQRTAVLNLDKYINSIKDFESTVVTNLKECNDSFLEFKSYKFKSWNYSRELEVFLDNNSKNIDLFHIHGVFMHTQYVASKFSSDNKKPFILTAHGMIQPWYLKEKALKKKIYFDLILNKILKKSTLLHAITPLEKDNLYKLTNHKNIVEIPNLINYSLLPDDLIYNPKDEYLLSLGRVHPGKGLDILLQAFSKTVDKKIKLKIVGSFNDYTNFLKKMCQNLKIEDRVEFIDGVYGQEKFDLYANAKAFIAPSHSEAIGMVNLEAAVCKTPVITTFNTGINADWSKNGGFLINPEINDLIQALNQISNWSVSERYDRGLQLRKYVENNYSWENKGHLWIDLYNSLK